MKIQVFGSGCPTCKKLYETTKTAAAELGIKDEVEYITDIREIMKLGVMQSPVLAINGKVALLGFVPNVEKIKKIITDNK
jgi:small redox-active disulfide protein 2